MKNNELLSKYNSILVKLQDGYMKGSTDAEEMKTLQMQFAETYHEIQEKMKDYDSKKNTTTTVTMDIFRYEELLDIESRVDTLISYVRSHGSISEEDMLLTLGYTQDAQEIKQKKDKNWAKYLHYANKMEEVADENECEQSSH